MIETFFGRDTLSSPGAFLASLAIGIAFGFVLERAGFGSSRRLSGVFYFTDMTVVKVMFTAVVTAMIGLALAEGLGLIQPGHLFLLPTLFGAHVVGGLIFGVGFVLAGWCPGTAAVGMASGKLDALLFLGGALLGGIAFNETYGFLKPLHGDGEGPVRYVFEGLGMSRAAFGFLFTLAAVGAFWLCERLEAMRGSGGRYWGTRFLKVFSLILVTASISLFALPERSAGAGTSGRPDPAAAEKALLGSVEAGEDHVEPEELADLMMRGDPDTVVVDVRPEDEYRDFHLRGAVNIPVPELPEALERYRKARRIILYSKGMTHPAQARDSLQRLGFGNVYILTDGLDGFVSACLRPVSLRAEPLSEEQARRVRAWRSHFLGTAGPAPGPGAASGKDLERPGLVAPSFLSERLGQADIRVVDLRPTPEYNTSHIPGAVGLNVESLRGNVKGIPSMLLPASLLAAHLSLMGIRPEDAVILVYGDKPHDATLAGMALERLGHRRWGILDGGFPAWASGNLPLSQSLPAVVPSSYPVPPGPDGFTVDAAFVLERRGRTPILDARPADFFSGAKSEEARAGHIPGALNRPHTTDVVKADSAVSFKPMADLETEYAKLLPGKDSPVIVHCRTGHQASQTYFVLKHLLGYRDVRWYDAGWTEWSARAELPATR